MTDSNVDNIKSQMRKGVLEYCILSTLRRKDAYASSLIGELKEARMIVVEGTLYPLLTRLKNQGMLSYRWEESTQGVGCFDEIGTWQALEEMDAAWNEVVDSVEYIKNK